MGFSRNYWGASVKDYENNLIKATENTIHKRESIFKDYLEVTKFHAEPVLLAINQQKKIQEIINKIILEDQNMNSLLQIKKSMSYG